MDLRSELIKKVAETGVAPLSVVEEVINYSFYHANKATQTNDHVEITGLGTFMIAYAKVKRTLPELRSMASHTKNKSHKEDLEEMIKYLEDKCPDLKNT